LQRAPESVGSRRGSRVRAGIAIETGRRSHRTWRGPPDVRDPDRWKALSRQCPGKGCFCLVSDRAEPRRGRSPNPRRSVSRGPG
jgi:hypothetical protein